MRMLHFVAILALSAPALAQQVASPPQDPELEEIIVSGQKPGNLRVAIERLQVAVYERFNALNSDDEFDIHCFEHAPTGSNIPYRTCAPNFVTRAEARAAETMVNDGRGGNGNNNNRAEQKAFFDKKSRELTEEMQRVAREDETLLRYLMRLDELTQLQAGADGGTPSAESQGASSSQTIPN